MGTKGLLDSIKEPSDIRGLTDAGLYRLASEIRERIIDVVSKNGGHLASNLGVVELTLALHRVFRSPVDKIIWDVGHQCYTHKLLTGRNDLFDTIRKKGGLSGFPKRSESVHDIVETGHSSTSLSSGLGVVVGQRLKGERGKVIAVIGDGALTAGMALEALNHLGDLREDLIIVLNDNNMSIDLNVGALSRILSRLTTTKYYQIFRNKVDRSIKWIPLFGKRLFEMVVRLKKGIKAIFFRENIFSDLGCEYVGPIDGHNIGLLTTIFKNIKDINGPVVVHVITQKGRGYPHAEGDPAYYHGVSPFSIVDGKVERKNHLSFTEAFSQALLDLGKERQEIVAITAAMTKGTGLAAFQREFPRRFFDVGITEQHAVTFAAGLAATGIRPVVAIYSTFMQRAVDQVIHDVALPELPVVFAMDRSGLVGDDGETHQGVFDIALFRTVPNSTLLAPASREEMALMLSYAVRKNGPVLIRYPKGRCLSNIQPLSQPLEEGRGVFVHNNRGDVLILTVGGLLEEALGAHQILMDEGISVDVYNLRFLKPLDTHYLLSLLSRYRYVLLMEEGVKQGGVGEYIQSLIKDSRGQCVFVHLGVEDRFPSQATRAELIAQMGLDKRSVSKRIHSLVAQPLDLHLFHNAQG